MGCKKLDCIREKSIKISIEIEIFVLMIQRHRLEKLRTKLFKGKAIVLLGPRQSGKTTLLKAVVKDMEDVLWMNADEADIRAFLDKPNLEQLKARIGKARVVVIDEAQRVADIGLKLKLMADGLPEVQLLVTGSSAFDLANVVNEPLTGRKWEYTLYPMSFAEMCDHHGLLTEQRLLHQRLTYGYYPDVVTSVGEEKEVLLMLSDSYLQGHTDVARDKEARQTRLITQSPCIPDGQ